MSNDGYLQIKIREQNEEINGLKNKIKELEIKIGTQEDKFNRSISLMQSAIDITAYKNKLEKTIKESSKTAFQLCIKDGFKRYDNIYLKHFSSIESVLNNHNDRIQENLSYCMALVRLLHIQPKDLEKMVKQFKDFWDSEVGEKHKCYQD